VDHPELDELFAQIALKHRFISPEQLADCRMALAAISRVGVKRSLQDIMIDKGYLTKEEVLTILRYLVREGSRPRLGNFEILGKLGEGGMGAVYKARQLSLDRIVALKVLPPSLAKDEVFVRRFIREARTAAKLSHPNIITVLDVGESNGFYYIAMEFVDGITAAQRVEKYGVFPENEALAVAAEVASGLAYAARYHIVHRDVKPANIMITKDGGVKLCDLGLAKQTFMDDASVTETGATIGTPLYMSPEQARGQTQVDQRSDIYSLGATLFFMVTGSPPFRGRTPLEILRKRLEEPPPWAADLNPNVSEWTCEVIQRMMATNPDDRFQTHEEVYAVLTSGRSGMPGGVAARAAPPAARAAPRRRSAGKARNRAVALLIAVMVVVVAVGLLSAVAVRKWMTPKAVETPPPAPQPRVESRAEKKPTEGTRRTATPPARKPSTPRRQTRKVQKPSPIKVFDNLAKKAEELAKQGRYGAAIEVLKSAPSEMKAEAQALIAAYEKEAVQKFQTAEKKVEELCEQKKFEDARRTILAMRELGVARVSDMVDRALAKISLLEDQYRREQKRLAKLEYRDLTAKMRELIADGKLDEAEAECDQLLQRTDLRPYVKTWLKTDKEGIAIARSFIKEAEKRGSERVGQPFTVRGIKGTIVSVSDGKITIDASGVKVSRELSELKPEELTLLAAREGEPQADFLVRQGVYLLYHGIVDGAREALEKAQQKGADVDRFMETLALIETEVKDKEVDRLFQLGKQLYDNEKYSEAADVLRKLTTDYSDTESFAAIKPEVEKLLGRAELRIGALENMVLIKAGKFIYQKGEEKFLPAYYIDRYEVTNAQYRKFVEYIAKTGDHSLCYPNEPKGKDHKPLSFDDPNLCKDDQPVVGVDWYDAYAYCAYVGKRLPTELEWEKAARGEDGRLYPWGNERVDRIWVSGSDADGYDYTAPVNSMPEGKSPYGCFHMLGNAAEWVSDWFDSLELNRVVRGGGWLNRPIGEPVTTIFRMGVEPTAKEKDIGFRCAKTP